MLTDVRAHTADELQTLFESWGQPPYRLSQLLEWLYVHRAADWEEMTNLPKALREQLRGHLALQTPALVRRQGSRDTTEKFLWRLADQSLIESVLIPANPALYGDSSDRHTLCVSTQVGCAYGCKFCASGLDGWKRNLGVEEIVNQVIVVERWGQGEKPEAQSPSSGPGRAATPEPRLVSNLVIMGMGEPLANYENLMKALSILNAPWGGSIGARKMTVSTSGLAPQIRKLADEPLQLRLAISLHGATDEIRSRLMPINRRYPLRELAAAGEYYQAKKGRMITFEYILIEGVNDGLDQVKPLAVLARRLHAKVNLIPYNRVEGLPWQRPTPAAQTAFLEALSREQVAATLRQEKGHDIDAACGQLRLKTERDMRLADASPAADIPASPGIGSPGGDA
ncbi:MAG TPA: 23S rRNA (adenine(2503)-C(2))-methyltransferase RlmN [Dongiaceae bacterium]|nr:23S rRNA (adenine(2503)-C(2))-methyltransferase RlmN [Dongiaceae bacterium]